METRQEFIDGKYLWTRNPDGTYDRIPLECLTPKKRGTMRRILDFVEEFALLFLVAIVMFVVGGLLW